MEVFFDNRQKSMSISDDLIYKIKKCISIALEVEGISQYNIEVSVSFVDNNEIRELNKNYRNIDKETDVLSFPMEFSSNNLEIPNILGDIVISTDKVIEQANNFKHSEERELLYLVCHSMFHLMGYDHIVESDKRLMREKEKQTMKLMEVFKYEKES